MIGSSVWVIHARTRTHTHPPTHRYTHDTHSHTRTSRTHTSHTSKFSLNLQNLSQEKPIKMSAGASVNHSITVCSADNVPVHNLICEFTSFSRHNGRCVGFISAADSEDNLFAWAVMELGNVCVGIDGHWQSVKEEAGCNQAVLAVTVLVPPPPPQTSNHRYDHGSNPSVYSFRFASSLVVRWSPLI